MIKNYNMKTYILFLVFILIGSLEILAQKEAIANRNLEVEKNYSDEIYAVHPIFDFGNIVLRQDQQKSLIADTLISSPVYAPDLSVQVRPIAYGTDNINHGHHAMIKIDKGTINPWHVQTGYVFNKDNHFNVQASFDYDQWQSQNVTDQYTKVIDGSIGLDYYLTHNIKTHLGFHYADNEYGLYGFQLPDIESTQQSNRFNTYGFDLGFSTFQTAPAKWNGGIQIQMTQWKDKISETNSETLLNLDGHVDFKTSHSFKLSLTPSVSISKSEQFSDGLIWNNIFNATINKKNMLAHIGVSAAFSQSKWNLWPSVKGHIQISPDDKIKISSSQELRFWGAQEVLGDNPYVDLEALQSINDQSPLTAQKLIARTQSAELSFVNKSIDKLELTGSIGFKSFSNTMNYIIGERTERLALEQVDFKQMMAGLMVERDLITGVKASLGFEYLRYMDESTEILHRPTFIISPKINGTLLDQRLDLSLGASINNPQNIQTIDKEFVTSSWRTNLNFSTRFKVMNQVSIFANVDNILNDEYQVWSGYNNFGRNISGGALFKF